MRLTAPKGLTMTVRYYHGGVPGLGLGANLKPADLLDALPPAYGTPGYTGDASLVFVTTDLDFARSFAAQFPPPSPEMAWTGGDVYEVEPQGPLQVDPDYPAPGLSYSVAGAQVVRVLGRGVRLGIREITRIQGPHARWGDGSPVYDADGYMAPAPEWAAAGWKAKHLRGLGSWVNLPTASRALAAARGDARRLPTSAEVDDAIARQDQFLLGLANG